MMLRWVIVVLIVVVVEVCRGCREKRHESLGREESRLRRLGTVEVVKTRRLTDRQVG
jgi:hypothetical protein